METITKIKNYIKKCYRLALTKEKQENVVWNDLKKLHLAQDWSSGFFENAKIIQTRFEVTEDFTQNYFCKISNKTFQSKVYFIDNFDNELASEFFILATHFNNLLVDGKVMIHINENRVEFIMESDLITPLLTPDELLNQISNHYHFSLDIYHSFQRLLIEQEAPAIIIADLMASREKNNVNNRSNDNND